MSCHSSNLVTLFIGTRFEPSVPFSILFKSNIQKYHKIGKNIANNIVNFNSYKLCLCDIFFLSDIFDGQEY